MIFEDILTGNLSFDKTTLFISFMIIISSFIAVFLSILLQKAFSKNNFPFCKTLFSVASLFSVISALFFGSAAINISENQDRKAAAKATVFSWLLITALGIILILIIYPIISSSVILIPGIIFISISAVNILPVPGFLCFSFLKYASSKDLSEKMEKIEKYKVFFIIFVFMLIERSGILNIITGLY